MSIFGVSEPIVVGVLLLAVVLILYGLPLLERKKNWLDYSNFNIKGSNAYWHYAGAGNAPSYNNLQPSAKPIIHNNGHATVTLEGLPHPLTDVVIDENEPDCNCVIKRTADALFGVRVDVLCNIDANGGKHAWDNVYVQNWLHYRNRFMEAAKVEVTKKVLNNKELVDELKEPLPTNTNLVGQGFPNMP